MDVNKEVDRLDEAVKRGDEDEAVLIDTKLAVYMHDIKEALSSMPKEHAETMGFYFRDWFMNLFDEFLFIVMIVIAFNIESELLAILLGGTGALFLIGRFFARKEYVQFLSSDIWRMRKEKMMANNYKMQLNYIVQSRAEHAEFLEQARDKKINEDANNFLQMFGVRNEEIEKELIDEDAGQEDTEPPEQK